LKIIEITGIPGSGKTTHFKLIKNYFHQKHLNVYDVHSIVLLAKKFPFSNYYLRKIFQRNNNFLIANMLKVIDRLGNLRQPYLTKFIANHPDFVSNYITFTAARSIPEPHKIMTLEWFFNTASVYGIAEELKSLDGILLVDEGFFHRIIHLFLSTEETLVDDKVLAHFLSILPESKLVMIDAPLDICENRIMHRGLPRRLKGKSDGAVHTYLENCRTLIKKGSMMLSDEKNKVFVINSTAKIAAQELAVLETFCQSDNSAINKKMFCF